MRTALDTNIISAVWSEEPNWQPVVAVLNKLRMHGTLVISGPVYAELLAYPHATLPFLERFLDGGAIEVDFDLGRDVWTEAGLRFARYMARRRKSRQNSSKRVLADFLIGAHALLRADQLLTLDTGLYGKDFGKLSILTVQA